MGKIKFGMNLKDDEKGLESRGSIPANEYAAKVTETDICPTKAGDGALIKMVWEVLKGEFKGRKVYNNINFQNPNNQTEEIARKTIISICDALGIKKSKSKAPSEWNGKRAVIKVIVKEKDRGPQNEIVDYDELGDFKAEKSEKKGKGKSGKKGKKKKPSWA